MKLIRTALVCLLTACTSYSVSGRSLATFTCAGSTIVLLDSAEAARVSARSDVYTRSHTPFDLSIRLGRGNGLKESDYLRAAARNVRSWPAGEQAQLRAAFATVDSFARASGTDLHLPDTIQMIKTTAEEEFGAEGYTRENRIMLNTSAQPVNARLLAHELWHVISRYNTAVRDRAYAVFHFKPCNNIEYKGAMNNQVITNPDCPFLMHYITIEKDGSTQDVTLMLYSKSGFKPGLTMGDYMNIGLLALTGDDAHKRPLLRDGRPVIHELMETPDFIRQVGMNTPYVLHVEEITAEHFAALVTGKKLPQQDYVEGVKAALK